MLRGGRKIRKLQECSKVQEGAGRSRRSRKEQEGAGRSRKEQEGAGRSRKSAGRCRKVLVGGCHGVGSEGQVDGLWIGDGSIVIVGAWMDLGQVTEGWGLLNGQQKVQAGRGSDRRQTALPRGLLRGYRVE
ncbi:hypothetical protein CLOP_g22621 [Closterium sp. NIES-67]|nr:hypothetical protein CLOP_g22621 [Closterium sp. NIES-67]